MNIEQILANIKWGKVTPENDPRLLDLEAFDREQSTGTNDDCVRAIERMIVGYLIPKYLEKIIGQNGWYPYPDDFDDCGDWFGLKLIGTQLASEETEAFTMRFRLGADIAHALSLPAGSELSTLMPNEHYYLLRKDIHETMGLRITDREKLINGFSLRQLQSMKIYLETIMPILMMKNI